MKYLKKIWVRVLISLFAGGILLHLLSNVSYINLMNTKLLISIRSQVLHLFYQPKANSDPPNSMDLPSVVAPGFDNNNRSLQKIANPQRSLAWRCFAG